MTHLRWSLVWWGVVAASLLAASVDALPRRHPLTRRARAHPRIAAAAPAAAATAATAATAPETADAPALRHAPPRLLEELRRKRNPQQTVSVKQAEEIGMCKFLVQQDVDPDRIPEVIWTVTCRQTGCRCGTEGDFRCTQLTTEMSVSYRNGAKNQMLYPNSGCICAAKDASDALSAVPQLPVGGDDDDERMRKRVDVILQQLLFFFNFLFGSEDAANRTIAAVPQLLHRR